MAALKYQVQDASNGYSAECIDEFNHIDMRENAESILQALIAFSHRVPPGARSNETPAERLGKKLCHRIVYKATNGRPISEAMRYETASVRFHGVALGIVAAIACGGLNVFETSAAERNIFGLVKMLSGENGKVNMFERPHPETKKLIEANVKGLPELKYGTSQGLQYWAHKTGDQIRVVHIMPISEEFFPFV